MSRNIPRKIKYKVLFKQRYTCKNTPGATLYNIGYHDCPVWKNVDCPGMFDEKGYEIDHIVEFSINQDNSVDNLQALCYRCHKIKTANFMKFMNDTTIPISVIQKDVVEKVEGVVPVKREDPEYNVKNGYIKFNGSTMRTITDLDGNIFYHAKNIILTVGYADYSQEIKKHVRKTDVVAFNKINCAKQKGHPATQYFTNEGLNRFLIKSRKELATALYDWLSAIQ